MAIPPLQPLTPTEKMVQFHQETGHSGIMPSGEGNYYDPSQVIRNDNKHIPDGQIFKGGPTSIPNEPKTNLVSTVTPNKLSFNNHGASGVVYNDDIAKDATLGVGGSPISNATNYPPQSMYQGPYIHYGGAGSTALLPDDDGAIRYYPSSNITATEGTYYPYGMSPTKYINARVPLPPAPTGNYSSLGDGNGIG